MRIHDGLTEAHRRAAREFGWMPRRGLAAIDPALARAATDAEVRAMEAAWVTVSAGDGTSVGCTAVERDAWASEQLGVELARVATVVSDGPDRPAVVRRLLDACVEEAVGADLLCLRVHGDDHPTLDAAQASGFRVVDLELCYVSDARLATPRPPGGLAVEVEVGSEGEVPEISLADRARLVDAAGRFDRSHLCADQRLAPHQTAAFYRAWTANAIDGVWGDRLAVARAGGRTVGIYSWVLDRDLERRSAQRVFHRSWAVVTEPGIGTMGALVSAAMGGGCDIRFTECETQASNGAVQRALHRLGAIRSIEPAYVLHRWR